MNLVEIKQLLSEKPTMMDLADEKLIIKELMKVDEDLVENLSLFLEIMDELLVSRSVSFYDLKNTDKPFFYSFSEWIEKISDRFEGGKRERIKDFARIYRRFPEKET
jgi:hypothetical protein